MTDILIKIAAVLALLAALFYGEQYIEGRGYARRAMEDDIAMGQQKQEATGRLVKLTQEKLDALAALANLTAQLEKNREDLQLKKAADLRARLAGPSLRYVTPQAAGCGRSGGGTESPAPGSAPDAGAAVVQLPRQISDDLWQPACFMMKRSPDKILLLRLLPTPSAFGERSRKFWRR